MNVLLDFLTLNEAFVGKQQPMTHVLLSGGRLFVPASMKSHFLDAYAKMVVTGQQRKLFVVERTGKARYRMFADFDIKVRMGAIDEDATTAIAINEDDDDDIGQLVSLMDKKLQLHDKKLGEQHVEDVDDILWSCIKNLPPRLCNERVCLCKRQSFVGDKAGFHLIWPDVYVDDVEARSLYSEWISTIETRKSKICTKRDFLASDIIDSCVYKNGSLRMPWSLKRGSDGMDGSYVPWKLISSTNTKMQHEVTFDQCRDSRSFTEVRQWLELCILDADPPSSRSSGGSHKQLPRPLVTPFKCQNIPKRVPASGKLVKNDRDASMVLPTLEDLISGYMRDMIQNDPEMLCDPSFHIGLTSMKRGGGGGRGKKKTGAEIIVVSSSKLCTMAKREHTNNHIYFKLSIMNLFAASPVSLVCRQHCHAESCAINSSAIFEVPFERLPRGLLEGFKPYMSDDILSKVTSRLVKQLGPSICPRSAIDIANNNLC